MKALAISTMVALSVMATGCNSKQATESNNQETSVSTEYYDTFSESYSTPSYSGSYSSCDEVDEMYDGVADETKAELRQACREAGADYDELFNDADIDRRLKNSKRRPVRHFANTIIKTNTETRKHIGELLPGVLSYNQQNAITTRFMEKRME